MNKFYNKMNFFETVEKVPAEIYYHYTSLNALYSIVKTKTFWLTSLKSSNDKKELYYKSETFLEDFFKVCNHEKDIDVQKYFQLIKKSIKLNNVDFVTACKQETYPYALCLSEQKDNLTHWSRYAENCKGVCIGVNVSSLRVLMQRMAITAFGVGVYDIGKVLYSSEEKEGFIRNIIITIINELSKQKGIDSDNIQEIIRKGGYTYAASAYTLLARFAKDNSFVDEDEVRLYHETASINQTLHLIDSMSSSIGQKLYTNLIKNFNEFVSQLHLDEEKFCMTTRGIRSYKELCFEQVWGSGTIPEIVLGPMCMQNKNELRHFLKASGLEGTKVSVSKVPIR